MERQDLLAREHKADELLEAGDYAAALDEYVWLWNNGGRSYSLTRQFQTLVEIYPPAHAVVVAMRDACALSDGETLSKDQIYRWDQLNVAIGDMDATLHWFDKLPANAKKTGSAAAHVAIPHLQARGRFAEAGALYGDIDKARWIWQTMKTGIERTRKLGDYGMRLQIYADYVSREAALALQSLLAAGRAVEAGNLARSALRLAPSQRSRRAMRRHFRRASRRGKRLAMRSD